MLNTLFVAFVSGLVVALASVAVFPSTKMVASKVKMNAETKVFSLAIALEATIAVMVVSTNISSHDNISAVCGLLWLIPALYSAHKLTKTQAFKEAMK